MGNRQIKGIQLERIGGDADFIVLHKDGVIRDAYFVSRAPIRGFEKLMIGKNPIFAVEASMRICGICHSAHGIAAAEAIEDALGIAPPPNGIMLREMIGLLNRIQSHLVHLIFIVRDLLKEKLVWDVTLEGIRLLGDVSLLLSRFGGAPTHPPYIVIGGVQCLPKEKHLEESKKKIKSVIERLLKIKDIMFDEDNWSEKAEILSGIKHEHDFMASHIYYGDRYNIDTEAIIVRNYVEYRGDNVPESAKKTTSCIALYKGRPVEVGPRARLTLYGIFSDNSLLGIQKARILETIMAAERVYEILQDIDVTEPSKTVTLVLRRGKGVGVYEAPRGTLVHYVEINREGRIARHRIVVPTMFNIPIIEKLSVGLPVEVADVVPRLYDPCIPCSTHKIEVRENEA